MIVKNFADGEIYVQVKESVRGDDVFIIQPLCNPVNENLMELLIIIDAFKRASAKSITAVIPYYGYARQDRKTSGREAITAKLVADLLTTAGADRVLAMDLHTGQIQGFFNILVDHIFATPILVNYIKSCLLYTSGHWKSVKDIPSSTPLSDKISKDLKKMGFKFVGSTIIYSFMQAIGMLNDHTTECCIYKEMNK